SLCRCRAPAQNIRGRAWPWHPVPFRLRGRPKEIPDEWSETSRALRAHQPLDCATGIAAGLGAVPLARPGTAASPGDGYGQGERRGPAGADTERDHTPAGVVATGGA